MTTTPNLEEWQKQITMLREAGMKKEADVLDRKMQSHLASTNLARNVPSLRAEKELAKLLTIDPYMSELKDIIRKLSAKGVDESCLIMGESGTGKELIARALHGEREGRFIPINCAGMPEYLIESELFGHCRGAFTGADRDKKGLIQEANGGTIFLDEIGDLQYNLQAKLLRVIEEGAVRPVGGDIEYKVFVRFVAATHHDLPKLVEDKKFRLDLYARLAVFPIITKPLRARRGDIKLIVNSLDSTGQCYDYVCNETIDKVTGKCFWDSADIPLNVRELKAKVKQYEILGRIL